jgi:Spy/CpxP family protein refolding chaperone
MTKIHTTLAALAMVTVLGAVAHAQSTTAPAPRSGVARVHSDSTWKRGRSNGARKRMGDGGMRGAFRGLNLTDAQKSQMKTIHQKYAPQYKPLMESMRPAMTEARSARQRGDTAAARAAFARTADTRGKVDALRQQERNEVRGILTADQQKTFDSNVASRKERGRGRGKGLKQG